ncbi:MAG: tryptophan 2,3-dioxygenase [Woeseia sp.]|nr:tryptophan 2,3-dioxygenase [Woeseia sp.]MBT8097707.1 tryptophan 2,3-dioxygenase [Woeseia sp.]NNE59983.1 tryptophan 2,3-dioxygenase [Woeseia sp.]NNL55558.1 tryptophan 2,3-dioxygenase [Woeseia sp.]
MTQRKMEPSIHTRLDRDSDYTAYLRLDKLLDAQSPLSDPPHHDELLFIIQHQVTELWIKLVIHEIEAAMANMRSDNLPPAVKKLARVKHVQNQMYNQWTVLDTLTPSEYSQFRQVFGQASGFQSPQYRLLEFLMGNKSRQTLKVFKQQPEWLARLEQALHERALFDEFLAYLARQGLPVPDSALERDFSVERVEDPGVVAILRGIYQHPQEHWPHYEMCEALMDISNNFQFWRFHHMKTVERIIGHKAGSGGSSGVSFLKKAIDIEFFPELIRVRTEIDS